MRIDGKTILPLGAGCEPLDAVQGFKRPNAVVVPNVVTQDGEHAIVTKKKL